MIDVALIDYAKCHEYARSLCGQYGIPLCDAEDIGSDAFLLSIRRSWRTGDVENDIAAANRLMYTSVLNVINRRNTRANKMIREADDITERTADDGEPSDDEIVSENTVENRAKPTAEHDADWQNPFWKRLFAMERQKLRNEKKKLECRIIKAGLKDSRLSLIKAALNISGSRFQTILDFFRTRFDLCFQALREYRGEN